MTDEEAIALIEQVLERGRLTKIQEIVFRQSWADKTYMEMAHKEGYDPGHIKDVGSELWRSLSKALGEKVTKNNLHGVIKRTARKQNNPVSSLASSDRTSANYADWGNAPDVPVFFGRLLEGV